MLPDFVQEKIGKEGPAYGSFQTVDKLLYGFILMHTLVINKKGRDNRKVTALILYK